MTRRNSLALSLGLILVGLLPAQTYTYSISADFPGGAVNHDNLKSEIEASSIVTALDYIQSAGDSLDIVFKAALSAGDKTILDGDATGPAGGLIAVHDSTAKVAPSPVVTRISVEDPRVEVDGHSLSASGGGVWTRGDYIIPEPLHLQGVYAAWQNGVAGDKMHMAIIHPATVGEHLTSARSIGQTTAALTTAIAPYFDPAIGAEHIEFWNDADTALVEVRTITALNGNVVTFAPALTNNHSTSADIRARFGSFSPVRGTHGTDGGLRILIDGSWYLDNPHSMTAELAPGLIFSTRLNTTSGGTVRDVVCSFVFRKPPESY